MIPSFNYRQHGIGALFVLDDLLLIPCLISDPLFFEQTCCKDAVGTLFCLGTGSLFN